MAWVVYHERMCRSVAIVQTHGGPCPLLPAGQSDGPFKCQSDSGAWAHFIKAVRVCVHFYFLFFHFQRERESAREREKSCVQKPSPRKIAIKAKSKCPVQKNTYKVEKGVKEWILKSLCPKLTMSILCYFHCNMGEWVVGLRTDW